MRWVVGPLVSNSPQSYIPKDFKPSADAGSDEQTELLPSLQAKRGAPCANCGQPLCFHQLLAAMALGIGQAPRCLECAARVLEESPPTLASSLLEYIQGRDCYRAAWKWASEQEGTAGESIPRCLFGHR